MATLTRDRATTVRRCRAESSQTSVPETAHGGTRVQGSACGHDADEGQTGAHPSQWLRLGRRGRGRLPLGAAEDDDQHAGGDDQGAAKDGP